MSSRDNTVAVHLECLVLLFHVCLEIGFEYFLRKLFSKKHCTQIYRFECIRLWAIEMTGTESCIYLFFSQQNFAFQYTHWNEGHYVSFFLFLLFIRLYVVDVTVVFFNSLSIIFPLSNRSSSFSRMTMKMNELMSLFMSYSIFPYICIYK